MRIPSSSVWRSVRLWGALSLLVLGCAKVTPARLPPTADAGAGQIVFVGERVTLDGSGSRKADGTGPEGLDLQWSVVAAPQGSGARLSNNQALTPWFAADVEGDFIFQLVVTEDGVASGPAIVSVRTYAPLEVVSQTPPDGATDVAVNAPVVIGFSEPVQPETVTPETVYVRDGVDIVEGFVEADGGNSLVVFTPFAPYAPGARLSVVVTQRVVAVSGRSLPASYQGRLVVSDDPVDTRQPAVLDVIPGDGSIDVSSTVSVTVLFDEPIEPSTIVADADSDDCPDNFQLRDDSDECVISTVSMLAANTRAVLTPMSPLTADAAYVVVVRGGPTGVADAAGNSLMADHLSDFTVAHEPDTTTLVVNSVYPGTSVSGVPIGASIVLRFSAPVLPSSVSAQSIAVVRGTTPANGTIELSMGNTVVTLTPDNLLAPRTLYNIVARGSGATALVDSGGTPLDGDGDGVPGGDYLSSFTTTDRPTFNGELSLPETIVPGDSIAIGLSDRDLDTSVAADTVVIEATSTMGEHENIVLTETGGRTGVFSGEIKTLFSASVGVDDDGTVHVTVGDAIVFSYFDEVSAAGGQRFERKSVLISESVAGIIVSAISGNTDEGGGAATFAVNLESEPTADVVVNFDTDDPTEGTVSPTSMTFTPVNYANPQIATVEGVDDTVADGDVVYHIVFAASQSADTAYSGLTPAMIELTNIDDDTTGIDVSSISAPTWEWGSTSTFTVVLESQPSADVVLTFDSDTPTEGVVDRTSLTFTAGSWSVAQTVTVTGQGDDIDDDDVPYAIVFDPATSDDPAFDGIELPPVNIVNRNIDTAGFDTGITTGLTTTENGGTAVFQVRLTSKPIPDADVVIHFDSTDASEGLVSVTELTFDDDNWDVFQPVIITGEDDAERDGDTAYAVHFTATTSTDLKYSPLVPTDIAVTNLEVGSNGVAHIAQTTISLGASLLISVTGESDEYGNRTAGPGNDTVDVIVTSSIDSETLTLVESSEGQFVCMVDGCLLATLESSTATHDNGVLEAEAGDTIYLTYTDNMRADGTATGVDDIMTATVAATNCANLVINEIVTTPQRDWNNDTGGGDGAAFTASPGSGVASDGTDEWIELYNAGACAVDLSGFSLHMLDASAQVYEFGFTLNWHLVFSAGDAANFAPGEFLVLGRPAADTAVMDDDIWVRLDFPDGGVLDSVALGTSVGGDGDASNNAPAGTSSATSDEAVARAAGGGAWIGTRVSASIGSANP